MMYGLLVVACVCSLLFGGLACASRRLPNVGLVGEQLRPCPGSPTCVSSEQEGTPSWIEPLAFKDEPETAWGRAGEAVRDIDGKVQEDSDDYLWATFTSRVFRFVDDLELRMDTDARVIHVRSGSRVGYSDLGVNRNRVEKLRTRFNEG